MEWFVVIRGDEDDLAQLAHLLNTPKLRVTHEDDGYLLRSSDFDSFTEEAQVHDRASELLLLITGAADLGLGVFWSRVKGSNQPFGIASVHRLNPDGTVHMTARFDVQSGLVKPGSGDGPVAEWLEMSLHDDRVAQVLRLLSREPIVWADLYNILELVKKDKTTNPPKDGWASDSEIDRFTHTANTPAAGDDSRHVAAANKLPAKPMLLIEARLLIEGIVRKWLEQKRTSNPPAPPPVATLTSP